MKFIKSGIFIIAILIIRIDCILAQQRTIIKTEKEYNLFFHEQLRKYHDTLSKNLNSVYNFFVRFRIDSEGKPDSIKFTEKKPAIMLEAVRNALNTMIITSGSNFERNTWIVQPFVFSFMPEAEPDYTQGRIRLCFELPKLDTVYDASNFNFNYNDFFLINEHDRELWGVKAVILPPIKFKRTIAFHYNRRQTFH